MAAGWEPRNDSNNNEGGDFAVVGALPAAYQPYTPTEDFTKRYVLGRPKGRRSQFVLYVEYTKGDETSIELRLSFKNVKDGSFYQLAYLMGTTGEVRATEPYFTASGKYRLAFPVVGTEAVVEVALKATGGTTGSVTLIPATEETD